MTHEILKPKKNEKKFLSIIYFLDGGKTHTLRISVSFMKACVFLSLFLIVIGFIGDLLFIKTLFRVKDLSQRLHASLDTIFEYQVKYEGIFEKIYTSEKKNPAAVSVLESAVSGEAASDKSHEDGDANKKYVNLLTSQQIFVKEDDANASVKIEKPVLHKNKNHLELSIGLRNRNQRSRAEGLMTASAEWVDAKGNKKISEAFVGPAEKVSTDSHPPIKFGIRQYTVKKFNFEIPESNFVLSKIEIILTDRTSHKSKYTIVSPQASTP